MRPPQAVRRQSLIAVKSASRSATNRRRNEALCRSCSGDLRDKASRLGHLGGALDYRQAPSLPRSHSIRIAKRRSPRELPHRRN
ncbi:hypothetical protein PSNTI_37030 [Stutzerimonas stutzeri]|nr:hypothetical protein PSNTI_37030 [Stutzerimonas stutzeri]